MRNRQVSRFWPTTLYGQCWLFWFLYSIGVLVPLAQSEVLTPPYFNLAENRRITATATCGDEGPELYCKLVGANSETEAFNNIIHGQVCDYCDMNTPMMSHPPEFAIDGSERWWQSPPLSRGTKYNEVNLTIDLGQEFHVAYVFITMANSPRPGVWALERSTDNGQSWKPWQVFAENPADCDKFFRTTLQQITHDDSVVCDTTFSKVVPLEGGEVVVSLLNQRPSASDFFSSDILQEWTRATNIRLRLLRTTTLKGQLMSVVHGDSTVTRRYFYSIKDISIGGRCRCNGHADLCDITDPADAYKLLCRCQHNTCGAQCEQCCPGYVQKAWRPATYSVPFVCDRCNCNEHSNECYYDEEVDRNGTSMDNSGRYEGGGVCSNCQDNTEGINCHMCKSGYFRPYGKDPRARDVCQPCQCDYFFATGNCEVGSGRCECKKEFQPPNCDSCSQGYYDYPNCKPCDCNLNGTRGEVCEVGGGQCPCKNNFAGKNCDKCAEGYYNFPDCLPCDCDKPGSFQPICDVSGGQCECNNKFGGRRCDQCENGYYDFPSCTYCNCDVRGTREGICDKSNGQCMCRDGYGGERCDQCLPEFFGYPDCEPCGCSTKGSIGKICDATGKCPCLHNFGGRTCDQCKPGFYMYPECLPCNCSSEGSMGVSCDDEGKCQCKANFDGIQCEKCREGFYNFPRCEECNCDPAGVIETFTSCADSPKGTLCQCKDRVNGSICNECKPLYWNLQQWNPRGCDECNCNTPGVIGGVQVCDGRSGQCPCKSHVTTRQCEDCADGFYNLTAENIFGCVDCQCDVGGAVNTVCDKVTGQCTCRPRIEGVRCTQPLVTHYHPTLYQFKHEAEECKTPSLGNVRFGYDDSKFPGYSWRGYAIFSQLQPEIIDVIYVDKSSLYRMVFHYLNPSDQTITAEVKVIPENPGDADQSFKVKFEPRGNFATISKNGLPLPLVLNPGRWHVHIMTDQYLLIDYFVLLPANYYEASILQKQVNEPCLLNTTSRGKGNNIIPDPCVKLKYPATDKFDTANLADGYIQDGDDRIELSQFYKEKKVLKSLGLDGDRTAVLSPQQREIGLDFPASKGGRYMLLVDYFTPMGANVTKLQLKATSMKGSTNGEILILNCKLATPCRQVVTTEEGEVAVFKFEKNLINLVLQAPDNVTDKIAIHSITAVPYGKWSLDHIRPTEYCVIRNGTCVASAFEMPPDSTKIEAEIGEPDRVVDAESMPEGVSDKSLVYLNGKEKNLTIPGRVPGPGLYTIIVHYFQPENPGFSIGVDVQNGQYYEAKLPVVHCPSTSGCRALVTQADRNQQFYIENDFNLILKSPQNVWVDYILVVPSNLNELTMNMDMDVEKYLQKTQLDETRKFIAECGKNHYHLPSNASDFCKAAVFSLTSEYNNGALPCQCDIRGSKSFECETFGGQCQCKENVIGRRCERCKTGFFGYPDCKPCDCPSTALCDDNTGECVCPPRVTGAKCDICAPLTYGFDPLIGCEECNCHPPGVVNGNLQCDLLNGQCECKPNIVGRSCDKCKPGHWAMPYCQLCDCDMRGTTEEICNQDTSQCYCKVNVEGRGCDTCKVGSFNLQESNPAGCTKCFCFGKTQRCNSAYLFWTQVTATKDQWTSVSIDPLKTYSPVVGYEIEFEDVDQQTAFVPLYIPEGTTPEGNETSVLYFKADINMNNLASYGGIVSYTLNSDPDSDEERETYNGPDVILEGRELSPSSGIIRIFHYTVEHLDGDNIMRMRLPLLEENFVVLSATGGLVAPSREQMMIVLKDLRAIYVRAGYWKQTREAKLSDFGINIGTDDHVHPTSENRALTIEQCQCPPNYQGLSCEECAQGYFRSPTGPHGGFCATCQCNGHSENCDPVSGVCIDCRHNTTGDHCEMCQAGFHGDATQGTPYDCLICACPLPMMTNNFATSCEFSYDGSEISCVCKDAYFGNRCEGCAPGHYGRPEVPGDYCKPCSCSGNIDVNDPNACDTVTGSCLKCLNHTSGQLCEYCMPGYFGDAIITKTCNKCSCNECGTRECDHTTGECQCLHNVIGVNCDLCAPDHYGLSRCEGLGCYSCDCGLASVNSQCDDNSGQCECRPGTTGRRCERCAPGYWNYTAEGCQACECNQDYAIGVGCNPETGQCSCLPGVVGEKCDRCPWRWVLIEDRGCQDCDACQHQLLDDTDAMATDLDPVQKEFGSVALSYFTTQKLAYFNDTAAKLEPDVKLLDPERVDLDPYYNAVSNLETDGALSRQKAEVTEDSLKDKSKQSMRLKDKSFEMESKVQEAVAKAQTAVYETKDLMEGLLAEDRLTSPQTDAARAEAEAIIATMQDVKFDPTKAQEENKTAGEILGDVQEFVKPIKALTMQLNEEGEKLVNVRDKLKDLRNQSDYSIDTSRRANEIMDKIKEAKFPVKIGVLEGRSKEMLDNIENATYTNRFTEALIDELDNSNLQLDAAYSSVKELQVPLAQKSDTLENELQNHKDTIATSQQHAEKLKMEADDLDDMLADTRDASENAVSAATAYKNIVDALSEALNAADMAKISADNATEITNGIGEEALGAMEPSKNLLILAAESESLVDQSLRRPLRDAKQAIELIEQMNRDTVSNLASINSDLERLEDRGDLGDVRESVGVSGDASERAARIQSDVDDILSSLPGQSIKQAKEDIPLATAITGSLEDKKPMFEEKKMDLAARLGRILKSKRIAAD
ncbi:Laminin subunit alpha [Orchesella cincta]|uniref:Laminin subunit alpha n=1 Tax=Orchesella cincta TaxID=48709 RepID=A0A1D2MHI4_ORCCI|nr:Laminin subunit alpha [Orchesella cincta]